MHRRGWKRATWLGAACAAAAFSACLDVTPITVAPPASSSPDASVSDAANAPDSSACLGCIHGPDDAGPGCATEVAACYALFTCQATFACATANSCFERGSLGAIEGCGVPCATEAGAVSGDPSYAAMLTAFSCIISRCGAACGLGGADN